MLDPKIEKLRPAKLRELQEKRFKKIVRYAYDRVPFLKKRFKKRKVRVDAIKSLRDAAKVPFTEKDDLRAAYPHGLLAVPLREVVEFHSSSGTTGKPTAVAYTERDRDTWAHLMARTYAAAGAKRDDVVHNCYGYGLFTGGLGFHYGAQALGMAVWPLSAGNTKRQLLFLKDMKPTILACTPSYALYLGEAAKQEKYDPRKDFRIRLGMFGAEPWSEEARARVEEVFGMRAHDNYGLSELYGPGVAVECPKQDGLHVWADEFYPEVIDPETGEVLGPGEEGELVFTMLTREAMPLLRYRTRDRSALDDEACACGRSMPRLRRITGRTDDMLIIGGANVFPSQVEHVLMNIEALGDWYEIVVDRDILDRLHVRAEVEGRHFSSKEFDPGALQRRVEEELHAVLAVRARIELLKPGSLPRTEGKAQRVIDLRKPA